jgi:hypothetical protein
MDRRQKASGGDKMNSKTSKLATLLGSASMMTMASAIALAQQVAQAQMAQAAPQKCQSRSDHRIADSRTAAVGVPVTNLSPQDFAQTGALTTADLFRTVPSANVSPGPVATQSGRQYRKSDSRQHPRPRHRRLHPFADDGRRRAHARRKATASANSIRPIIPGPLARPHRHPGGRRLGHLRFGRCRRRDQHHSQARF